MADAGVGETILLAELAAEGTAAVEGGAALGAGLGAAEAGGATAAGIGAAEAGGAGAAGLGAAEAGGMGAAGLGAAGTEAGMGVTATGLGGAGYGGGLGATGTSSMGITGLGGTGYGGGMAGASIPGIGMTPGAAMPGTIPGVAGSSGITGGMGLGAPGGFAPGATLGGSGQAFGSFGGASVAPVEAAPSAAPVWNLGTSGGATGEVGAYGSQVGGDILAESTKEAAAKAGEAAAKDVTGEAAKQAAKKTAEDTFLGKYGMPLGIAAATTGLGYALKQDQNKYGTPSQPSYTGPLSQFKYSPSTFKPTYATPNVYTARYADGGIASLNPNAQFNLAGRSDTMFPQSQMDKTQYATPSQLPTSAQVLASDYDSRTNPYTGAESPIGMARGGIASLGSYSDGGQMLRGPGDGVSDSIPASIGGKQPARLADGEFVVPARAVSELGNGSTDAGAKQLYAMLNRIEKKRKKGKGLAYQANPSKMMPV